MDTQEILDALREESATAGERMRAILTGATERDDRNLTAEETAEFDRLVSEQETRDARIVAVEAQLGRERAAAELAARTGGPARVTHEGGPYHKGSARHFGPSFFRDLWQAKKGNADAIERLNRNNKHVADAHKADQERAGLTTTAGGGGEFVPPLWLEQDFVKFVRPGRPTANVVVNDTLPPGTNSINIPKVVTGTAVAAQGTQNTAIQETDLTTTSISSSVYTVAGGQTVAMQLIEQSPLDIDSVVLQDLAAAYGVQVDTWVLNGSGSGQPTGILNLSGTSTLTYTDATPTLMGPGKLYAQMAKGIGLVQTNRFMPPTHIIMHPLRWDWIMSTVDAQNRAVVLPHALPMLNPSGDQTSLEGQGIVGTMLGLPVLVDASMPTNLGGGSNQDAVVIGKMDDLWLWEGTVRAEAFEQTYANQLSLFLRLYNYLSFQPARYPKSLTVITGTGLTTPAF